MPSLTLPALAGSLAHGWLPALGLTRILSTDWPQISLAFDRQTSAAILDGGPTSISEAAQAVRELTLDTIAEDAVLPGVDPGWPPKDGKRETLAAGEWGGPDGPLWQRTLVSPIGLLHPLIRPHAAQTLRGMIGKMVGVLRKEPGLVVEALTRYGLTDQYPGGLWMLRWTTDSTKPQASPGRDWLALMSLPWMPVYEHLVGARPPVALAPGWRVRGDPTDDGPALTWTLWTEPVPAVDIPRMLRDSGRDPYPRCVARRRRRTGQQRYDPPLIVADRPVDRGAGAPPDDGLVEVTLRLPPDLVARVDAITDELADEIAGHRMDVDDPRREVLEGLLRDALLGREIAGIEGPLYRLQRYGQLRESLHDDVRDAIADGVPKTQIAEISGLSRQWVAKIAKGDEVLDDDTTPTTEEAP